MTYTFEVISVSNQPTLVGRATVELAALSAKLAEIFPAVMTSLGQQGKAPAGFPFTRYLRMGEDTLDIEAGMPVAEAVGDQDALVASNLPSGRVVKTVHCGPYDQLGEAHEAMTVYIEAQNLVASGDVWEVYITDPGAVPNPADWKTEIYSLLK